MDPGDQDEFLVGNETNNVANMPSSVVDTAWMDQPSTSSGVTEQLDRSCSIATLRDLYKKVNISLGEDLDEIDAYNEHIQSPTTSNVENVSEQPTEASGCSKFSKNKLDLGDDGEVLVGNETNNVTNRPSSVVDTAWMDQPSTSSGVMEQLDRSCSIATLRDLYKKVNISLDEDLDQIEADNEHLQFPTTSNVEHVSEQPTEVSDTEKPVKKKRGRPCRKNPSEPPTAPTRKSSREKKPLEKFTGGKEKGKTQWSKEEKQQLLKGVEEFGHENIKGIQRYLTTKSESEIKSQIKVYQKLAQEKLQNRLLTEERSSNKANVNCVNKLDEWIAAFEHLQKDSPTKQFALSIFFELVSEYGKYPSKEEAGGIDFRALYRWIHCMLNGQPFYGMNQVTRAVLNDMLKCTDSIASEYMNAGLIGPQLHEYPAQVETQRKTYPGSSRQSSHMTVGKVLNHPDMNPLKLPPHMLQMPAEIKPKEN